MAFRHRPTRSRFPLALLAFLPAAPASGQLISLRSVPVASGEQFLVLPSQRLGMAGPTIAVDDAWLDPFVNPAKGMLISQAAFFGSPTYYGISNGSGAGRSLPLAGIFSGESWFGGASLALQQIENDEGGDVFFAEPVFWNPSARRLDESAASNLYLRGFMGRRLGDGNVALGLAAAWAGLDAVDGVDLLYQGSDGVDQNGDIVDLRFGLFGRDDSDRRFELLLLRHHVDMTHLVRYVDWIWLQDEWRNELEIREVTEHDETVTWGLHGGYDAPISEEGWRLGGAVTVNRKDHPKIPNYEIQSIPRDPGETWAFDFGVGLSRSTEQLDFGLDVVFEPIWSNTWSEFQDSVVLADGRRFEAGEKEVENEFFFRNVHLRVGVSREGERWGAQLGIEASAYAYDLEQFDNIEGSRRTQDEAWMEWTPSWGASFDFGDVALRYSGSFTTGTGRPGVDFVGERAAALDASDFIVAPQGPLTLQDVHVLTHQVTIRLPIR